MKVKVNQRLVQLVSFHPATVHNLPVCLLSMLQPIILTYQLLTHSAHLACKQSETSPPAETAEVTKQNSNETVSQPVDKAFMHNFFPLYSISPAPIVLDISSTDD